MKLIKITSRWDKDKIILKGKAKDIKELLESNRSANLWGANLQDANLRGANLWDANLQGANLQDANLRGANLWDANLQGANLQGANLQGANLRDANLQDANLQDANLQGANLRDANLRVANLQGARNLDIWWHVHHEKLWEPLTEPIRNRINYIKSDKPEHEQELRLRLMKPVIGELPKDEKGWEKLHKEECPNCPWDGHTIFPDKK